MGIDLDTEQKDQLIRYSELINQQNKLFNLTGANSIERIFEELFIRSLRILNPAGGREPTKNWFFGKRLIDIGTGAGIPGMGRRRVGGAAWRLRGRRRRDRRAPGGQPPVPPHRQEAPFLHAHVA